MPVRYYAYTATLERPLVIGTPNGDPNSVRASLFIPGATVRGAVARALGWSSPDFDELILSGAVRYLNAYPSPPEPAEVIRSLPAPRSWKADKLDPRQIDDLAAGDPGADNDDDDRSAGESRPRTAAPFPFWIPGPSPRWVRPRVTPQFHNQRDRIAGRATEERGAIFVYESLDAGTRLVGLVAIDGDDATIERRAARLEDAFASGLRLGRSRRTQYGGAPEIAGWSLQGEREVATSWSELQERDLSEGESFRLLLTSDAIVRSHATGQVDPCALGEEVEAALGGRCRVRARYVVSSVVSGFNAKWRLALPQAMAAAAGSILGLEAVADLPLADLLAVEQAGLGERRIDGFGCLLFLTEPRRSHRVDLPAGPAQAVRPSGVPGTDTPAGALFALTQKRLFSVAVSDAVEALASQLTREVGSEPVRRSLLGRLRVPLRSADGLETLRSWLHSPPEGGGLRSKATDQLEDCRLTGGCRLDEWLRQLLPAADEEPAVLDALADELFRGRPLERSSLTGEVDASVRRELALAARPLLIDAVLALLARTHRGESRA